MPASSTKKHRLRRPLSALLTRAFWSTDDFAARSPDELTLTRGDRIELIERDDDFGDGWFLGKHLNHGTTGLFPEGEDLLHVGEGRR